MLPRCGRWGSYSSFGSRTGIPPTVTWSPVRSGRDRPDDRLQRPVDDARLDTGDGQRSYGSGPLGPGVPGPPDRGRHPHEPVVAETGDQLGHSVEGRASPERLEPAVHPFIQGSHNPAEPLRPAGSWSPGRRSSTGSGGLVRIVPGPDRRRIVLSCGHAAPPTVAPSTTDASSGSPP